jgi:hypothetical protein
MGVATGLHGKKVAGIEGLPMKSPVKFALLCGVLTVIAAILCSLSFGIRVLSRGGDLGILISGVVFAVPVFLGPYFASRRGWLSSPVSIGRAVLATLPLPFLPVAFFVGMIGWGDVEEHLIRAALHTTHRELPDGIIGALIVVGIVVLGAAAISLLIWISISVLTKRWRAQTLLILWTGCAILSGLFWAALFALKSGGTGVATIGQVLVFICGSLFAFAVEMNATASRMSLVFRFAAIIAVLALVGGGSVLIAKSVPEKRFPKPAGGPVWTFDLASTGCRPVWGGPDSSAAANEITFATNETLGMAFETAASPLANNRWEYKSCVFSMNVKSGKPIAQISINGGQPIIYGSPDGNFKVSASGRLITYTPTLEELGEPETENKPTEKWTAAKWHNFRSDPDGKLWFEDDGRARLLAQYRPNGAFIHPLGAERVLVTAGREFAIFSADGARVSTERFTREGVRFAALSADHRRFAVAVYLWGVGDPSYLEEERIIVYDAETGKAIAAVPSEPLPRTQSWAALSPDGTLLVVGAQSTLRLFRLPQERM